MEDNWEFFEWNGGIEEVTRRASVQISNHVGYGQDWVMSQVNLMSPVQLLPQIIISRWSSSTRALAIFLVQFRHSRLQ